MYGIIELSKASVGVFTTNEPRCFSDTFHIDLGLSDFHNCPELAHKMYALATMKRSVNYMCMRKVADKFFVYYVDMIPIHICNIFWDGDSTNFLRLLWMNMRWQKQACSP